MHSFKGNTISTEILYIRRQFSRARLDWFSFSTLFPSPPVIALHNSIGLNFCESHLKGDLFIRVILCAAFCLLVRTLSRFYSFCFLTGKQIRASVTKSDRAPTMSVFVGVVVVVCVGVGMFRVNSQKLCANICDMGTVLVQYFIEKFCFLLLGRNCVLGLYQLLAFVLHIRIVQWPKGKTVTIE